MNPERQRKIEAINRLPDGIRSKVDKNKSLRVFLRNLLRYPISTFQKSKFAEKMPNVYFGYSDHPLDREATPYQYGLSYLTWNRGRKANCVLRVELQARQGNSFRFLARGYDVIRLIDQEADGIQHTYRVDKSTPYQKLALQLDFLRPDIYRLRLAPGESVPSNQTPMVVGDLRQPGFPLELVEHPERYQINSEKLRLEIFKRDFRIEVYDREGRLVTESGSKTKNEFANALDSYPLGFVRDGRTRQTYALENFTLYPGEAVYGLGERFDGVDKVGKTIGQWAFEGFGNTAGRVYKPVPFFMSTRGYGVFLNESRPITHWIGTRETCTHQIAVQQGFLDYYFFYGPQLKHILDVYTGLTGKAAMPPKWSFGAWMSRWSYYTQEQVLAAARLLREMGIPCDVIHIDAGWFEDEWACDWTFAPERFPDPAAMFAELRRMGLRVSLWQHPYVLEQTRHYPEARRKGILAKRHGPFVWLFMYPGSPIDFSNPEGVAWYQERLRNLLELGAAVIKVDFGEQIEPHMEFRGTDSMSMHNLYPLLYNQAAFQAVLATTGEGIIWARAAYAGSQRYPLHWSGDNSSNYANLLPCLQAGLSLGLSGFTFWSQDTGGFGGAASDELYLRWTQLSIFQSHLRYHSPLPKYNEPWNYTENTQAQVRRLLKLRYRLIPYLYSEGAAAAGQGLPLLRHLALEYQDDPTVYHIDDQFLCGERLLVAPVMTPDNRRRLYLPNGRWYDFWTGEATHGPVWLELECPLERIPVYVRGGTLLLLGPAAQHTGELTGEEYEVRIYPDENGRATFNLHTGEGEMRCAATVGGEGIEVRVEPAPARMRVGLPNHLVTGRVRLNGAECQEVDAQEGGCRWFAPG